MCSQECGHRLLCQFGKLSYRVCVKKGWLLPPFWGDWVVGRVGGSPEMSFIASPSPSYYSVNQCPAPPLGPKLWLFCSCGWNDPIVAPFFLLRLASRPWKMLNTDQLEKTRLKNSSFIAKVWLVRIECVNVVFCNTWNTKESHGTCN